MRELQHQLMEIDEDLPAVLDTAQPLRRAALTGALATSIPALALLVSTPLLARSLLPLLISSLHAVLPFTASFYLSLTLVTLGPALLALPVAALGAAVARREGHQDRDRGLAAAAGASLATTGLTGGYIMWLLLTNLEFPMWGPLIAAMALAVGVVGGASFLAVPSRSPQGGGIPALYQGLLAAGLGVPSLIVGAGLWSTLTTLIPALSVGSFQNMLSPSLGVLAYSIVYLTALAPISYAAARAARRRFPGLDPRAVGLGLLFPPTLPFLILSASLLTHGGPTGTLAAMVAGNALGVLPHVLAILWGLETRLEAPDPKRLTRGTSV